MTRINQLAKQYNENPTNGNFYLLYKELEAKSKKKFRLEAKVLGIDEQELRAAYDDLIMDCLETFTDNFEHYFNKAYRIKKKELVRNTMTRNKYIKQVNLKNDEQTDIEVIDRIIISKGDFEDDTYIKEVDEGIQRQLVTHFISKTKDPLTTAIVKEVLNDETSNQLKPTAIGRKLGVHHMVVTRKIAQLKKYYDSTVFGDYRDYLCG